MDTIILPGEADAIDKAVKLLNEGELVAIPTETVYGLAASSFDAKAVDKIFAAKMRPQDNPLISHIASIDMLGMVADNVPSQAFVLADAFWPGPLTLVLPKAKKLADNVCAGLESAAVRMPNHKVALAIIKQCGFPLAAPSANLSGSPSPTSADHVFSDLNGKIKLIIDGGVCDVGVESTVVSLCGEKPVLLRPGGVSKEQLQNVLSCEVIVANAVLNAVQSNEKVQSPGMKYKHYAPKAKVVLVKGSLESFNNFVNSNLGEGVYRLCFNGEENTHASSYVCYGDKNDAYAQAHNIFAALRQLDTLNAQTVYVRCPSQDGVSLAVYNRLLRASAFNVIEV